MNRLSRSHLPNSISEIAPGVWAGAIVVAVGGLLLGTWAATQYAAYRLGFHPALGAPLLSVAAPCRALLESAALIAAALGTVGMATPGWRTPGAVLWGLTAFLVMLEFWPLYAPVDFFVWWWRFGSHPDIADVWTTGTWIIIVTSPAPIVIAGAITLVQARQLDGSTDSHGSARWATRSDLTAAGLIGGDAGVYIGAWSGGRLLQRLHHLRHDGPEHVLAFAPSQSDKSVGLALPTLLAWPGSAVVTDFRGEHWALTAGWRRQAGSHCLKFDPTSADGSAARYNPLLEVRPWPRDVRDAQRIAAMLIDPDGRGPRTSWDQTARNLLVGLILHALYAERDKSFRGCLTLLANPTRPIESTLDTMLRTLHDPSGTFGWKDASGQRTRTHPAVAGAAHALLNTSDTDRARIVSAAITCLKFARDPVVSLNTETSDFAVRDLLLHHDQPLSLYLTVPPAEISRARPLLRLLLHQVVSQLTESRDSGGGRPDTPQSQRLLLMLDEFLTLGRMDMIQSALAYLPSYGIRAYLIVPDLAQLTHTYGHDASIISNCNVRVAYTADKVETAKFISDMAVRTTVQQGLRTDPGGYPSPVVMHVMAREPKPSRPLLTPDDVMRLPTDDALIFVAGCSPIYGKKIPYSLDPVFGARAKIPPPTESDRLVHDWSCWTARVAPAVPEVPSAPAEPNSTRLPPDLQTPPDDSAAPPIPASEAF